MARLSILTFLKKKFMKTVHRRQVAGGNRIHGLLKIRKVVGVGQQVAMSQHVDPNLPVGDDLSDEHPGFN